MTKALRWAGIGLASIVGLLVVAALVIFALSEMALRREHKAAAETLAAPSPALLADAPRQAKMLGCTNCHGEGLRGKVMEDIPNVARIVAPNITEVAARASDQQLAAAIRQGIGHDGRALFVMPSPEYSRMTDAEVGAMVAWIRSLPRVEGVRDRMTVRALGRLGIVTGKFASAPEMLKDYRSQTPIALGAEHEPARHFVAKACAECHGPALFGAERGFGTTPDLRVAAGYSLDQFKTLMRTGRSPAGKDLGLMAEVARNDFVAMTDEEIAAVHAYLVARAKRLGD
jgi:mono/diheme cytochrome c family protein